MSDETRRLVVRADDVGMCHAVNEGTRIGLENGIVTQVSLMAPCPWFPEAVEFVRHSAVPAGLHMTLTCEWDYLRWRPLTNGASLGESDGTFYRTVEEAATHLMCDEALTELLAQAEQARSSGIPLSYLDVHMGAACQDAYGSVSVALGLPLLIPGYPSSFAFTSRSELSPRSAEAKKAWLLRYLEELGPGVHLLVCHLAVSGPEIASLTNADSAPFRWAEEYRASDLQVVCDPDIRQAIDAFGIELTSIQALLAGA